ncbi:hypothetical protein AVEN_108299-1 [Araneus ventricosus]|uniref:Histone-lysine N-methyltransferase SETMAR n=1 Tax=Araneus ventricosus TaxID=182803 RepID=A0A4Y2NKS4_ARAVE|nr:hypothetical protein AVEN_108299-1 [Araneus ventricosus]
MHRRVWPPVVPEWSVETAPRQSRPHTPICMRQFLATRKVTVLEHPPYSPDLAPADFLFPHLKGALKGLRFSDIAQI